MLDGIVYLCSQAGLCYTYLFILSWPVFMSCEFIVRLYLGEQ